MSGMICVRQAEAWYEDLHADGQCGNTEHCGARADESSIVH